MRKERRIINTNIRLNLCDEQDRKRCFKRSIRQTFACL